MKTKIIPFDLETAKKIQVGEIEGKIKTRDGVHEMRIVCYESTARFCGNIQPIIAQNIEDCEEFFAYYKNGNYVNGEDHVKDLVLEVPDNEPQFKVGDKVRVRPNDTHSHFVKQYDNCIGKIVGEHDGYFVVIATRAFQGQFRADELELVEKTGKHEFKPFDKVLVRDGGAFSWYLALYAFYSDDIKIHRMVGGTGWKQCIPYEGNEKLLGKTDKPKED